MNWLSIKSFLNENLSWLLKSIAMAILGIIIWKYKKRAKAASDILAAFRVFSKKTEKTINTRIHLPKLEQEENLPYEKRISPETKVFHHCEEFCDIFLPLIDRFPKKLSQKLGSQIKKTEKYIQDLSGNILSINANFSKDRTIAATKALSIDEVNEKLNSMHQNFKKLLKWY